MGIFEPAFYMFCFAAGLILCAGLVVLISASIYDYFKTKKFVEYAKQLEQMSDEEFAKQQCGIVFKQFGGKR